jgi:hypothetical protein
VSGGREVVCLPNTGEVGKGRNGNVGEREGHPLWKYMLASANFALISVGVVIKLCPCTKKEIQSRQSLVRK